MSNSETRRNATLEAEHSEAAKPTQPGKINFMKSGMILGGIAGAIGLIAFIGGTGGIGAAGLILMGGLFMPPQLLPSTKRSIDV